MLDRREALRAGLGAGVALPLVGSAAHATARDDHAPTEAIGRERIPATGELLPRIGLGTSRTLNVRAGEDTAQVLEVVRLFLASGGSLIDSSPMYGESERVVGDLLGALGRDDVFYATKVWTDEGREAGIAQMRSSAEKMGAARIDLMQVHNLVDYDTHIETIRAWKAEGELRYIGITEMRDLARVERIVREDGIDFLQIPYSIQSRQVEERVLPACLDHGVAVLVMRPFERGALFQHTAERELPDWAADIDCTSWAQFFLKFLLGHPAVTCPIPATSKPHHLVDNMRGGVGRVPDAAMRDEMIAYLGL